MGDGEGIVVRKAQHFKTIYSIETEEYKFQKLDHLYGHLRLLKKKGVILFGG